MIPPSLPNKFQTTSRTAGSSIINDGSDAALTNKEQNKYRKRFCITALAMKNHWAMEFYNLVKSKGIKCSVVCVINGWIETILIGRKVCFTKTATYNLSRRQFFQGVDPSKLIENGDFVLICGGENNILLDIFIIPWDIFFKTLAEGEPINTYKPPREYFQYKFYIRDRDNLWIMSVQGGNRPFLNVSNWHYNVAEALAFFTSVSSK